MKLVAIAGDDLVPPATVWRHMQNFPEARKSQFTVQPADYGAKKIGHIGLFQPQHAATWPDLIS